MYTWCPSNLNTFSEVFETPESAIENAQTSFENKTGDYEDNLNSPIILIGKVVEFDLEKATKDFIDGFNDFLNESLSDFAFGANVETEAFVFDRSKENEFKEKATKSLLPLIKKYYHYFPKMLTEGSVKYSLIEKKYLSNV